jgi:hypothetical protein
MCRHCRVRDEPCEEFIDGLDVTRELGRLLKLVRYLHTVIQDEILDTDDDDDDSAGTTADETESSSGIATDDESTTRPASPPHSV